MGASCGNKFGQRFGSPPPSFESTNERIEALESRRSFDSDQSLALSLRLTSPVMKVKTLCFFFAASLAAAVPVLGQANPPVVSANPPVAMDSSTQTGKALYEQHCAACHGLNGDGNGPASVWLFPRPRNFSAGLFKIQSNPAGSLPTDDDLLQTVTRGMPGSSMPSFTYLTEPQRRAAVQYVKFLTAYTDESGKRINRFEEAKANNRLLPPINVPPEPPVTVQALAQGVALYQKLQCFM